MKLLFMGTGAAEGIPAVFCRCEACRSADKAGGKSQRTRTSMLVNGRLLVDLSPDLYLQKLRYGLDLAAVELLAVTHSHTDHLDANELTRRSTANYCHIPGEQPLRVAANSKACRLVREALALEFGSESDTSIELQVLRAGGEVACGTLRVVALPARHDPLEECLLYLICEGDTALLYANDTALPEEGFFTELEKALAGRRLRAVSMDCTYGARDTSSVAHMGLGQNLQLKQALEARGLADAETRFYATHFSHNCGMGHEALAAVLQPHGITAAWDGMEVEL